MKSEICFASCQNFSKLISPLGSLLEQPSFRKYKSFTNKLKNGMMIWKEINKIKGHSLTKSCFPYINSIISKSAIFVELHLFLFAACFCTFGPPHGCLETGTIYPKVTGGVHLMFQNFKLGSIYPWPLEIKTKSLLLLQLHWNYNHNSFW